MGSGDGTEGDMASAGRGGGGKHGPPAPLCVVAVVSGLSVWTGESAWRRAWRGGRDERPIEYYTVSNIANHVKLYGIKMTQRSQN